MSRDVPTAADINSAHDYAMSKLCSDIPAEFGGPGLTQWDDREKVCRITERGCEPRVTNPISQPMFKSNGEYRNFSDDDRTFGEFWKRSPPGFYQWLATEKSGGQRVCARANFLLWQWCMIPGTRAEGHEPGITNTPRFQYNIRNGKEECYIPKEYCDSKGVSYDANKKDCYVSNSQKILEFFTGSVLVRKQRASDKRLKDNIIPLRENFPHQGINVYAFEWNDTAKMLYGLTGHDIGFLADEIDPEYVTVDKNGYKNIKTEIRDDYMKKISDFLKIKDEIKNRITL